jgi:hypothetical protein
MTRTSGYPASRPEISCAFDVQACPGGVVGARGDDDSARSPAERSIEAVRGHSVFVDRNCGGAVSAQTDSADAGQKAWQFQRDKVSADQLGGQQAFDRIDRSVGEHQLARGRVGKEGCATLCRPGCTPGRRTPTARYVRRSPLRRGQEAAPGRGRRWPDPPPPELGPVRCPAGEVR